MAEQDSSAALIARIEGRQSPNRQGLDPYTLDEVMQKYRVPGVSVAVIKGFDIQWNCQWLSAELASATRGTSSRVVTGKP